MHQKPHDMNGYVGRYIYIYTHPKAHRGLITDVGLVLLLLLLQLNGFVECVFPFLVWWLSK